MKCIYLGRSQFVSKKGTACFTVNFGVPFAPGRGDGYKASNFFIDEKSYSDFKDLECPSAIDCDIRYINGADALISYDLKTGSIDLWD